MITLRGSLGRYFVGRCRLFVRGAAVGAMCLMASGVLVAQSKEAKPDEPAAGAAVVGAAGAVEAGVEGDAAAEAFSEQRVKALLRQLDADLLAERDAAEKQLIGLGKRVLDFLPKVNDSTGAELRVRLQRISEQLSAQAIKRSIEPSQVTLMGEFTVADALAKITEQTHNRFSMDSVPQKTISLQLQNESFWKAVDTVLDAAELDINPFTNNEGVLTLQARAPQVLPRVGRASYAGIFRLETSSIEARRSIRSPEQSSLHINLTVAWEPRLQPVYFQLPMKNFSAETGSGAAVSPGNPNAMPEYSPNSAPVMDVEIVMALPDRSVDKLSKLSGQIVAAVPSEKVFLEFDNLDKRGRKVQQVGELTVTIESVRKNQAIYEVSTKIKLANAGQTMDSFRGWVRNNSAYLKDSEGNRTDDVGSNTTAMRGDEVDINYFFDMFKGPDKYRFIYEAPGAVMHETVAFEMKDIPLP